MLKADPAHVLALDHKCSLLALMLEYEEAANLHKKVCQLDPAHTKKVCVCGVTRVFVCVRVCMCVTAHARACTRTHTITHTTKQCTERERHDDIWTAFCATVLALSHNGTMHMYACTYVQYRGAHI